MTSTIGQKLVILAAITLLLSFLMVPIASAVLQVWYLTELPSPCNADYSMQKSSIPQGSVGIEFGESKIWTAEHSAEHDIGFARENWQVALQRSCSSQTPRFGLIGIGTWDGNQFRYSGLGILRFDHNQIEKNFDVHVWKAWDIPKDSWLALKITHGIPISEHIDGIVPADYHTIRNALYEDIRYLENPLKSPSANHVEMRVGCTPTFEIVTGDRSYMSSPSSDPGYPVPDVSAWVMLATGLGVTGWIVSRVRRKNEGQSA